MHGAGAAMTASEAIAGRRYSHDLLIHDRDDDLVAATRAFVERGLASGGRVLVHSVEDRVDMLREALGSHPRLDYGLDRDLYLSPSKTLFAYERARKAKSTEMWVTGTVPLGDDAAGHAAWLRYESLVNEVLGHHAFHALCTYDARTVPASTIAAAKAAHPGVSAERGRARESADYLSPAAFLAHPMAGVPAPPTAEPSAVRTVQGLQDVRSLRHLLARVAESASALPREAVEGFVVATHEVVVNALEHGEPPVELTMWTDITSLARRVSDVGPGIANTLAGYHRPVGAGGAGLWMARQLCDDVFITN